MVASSGAALFHQAEVLYAKGRVAETFDLYQQAIKKILKDENVTSRVPNIVPAEYPQETLGCLWRNFVSFFRDSQMPFDQDTAPEAYKLLSSFKPTSEYKRPQFKTPRAKILLKGMQITAGLTLGILAWDKRDRATAAKRYKEALDLAATHTPFVQFPIADSTQNFERWVATDVQTIRDNLNMLVQNDVVNAAISGEGAAGRRDTVEVMNARIEGTGDFRPSGKVMIATDACKKCGKRGVKLQRCGACKMVCYCDADCQKADWSNHKVACKAAKKAK